MKQVYTFLKKLSFSILFLGFMNNLQAQTTLWYDDFENPTNPSSGQRIPSINTGVDNIAPGNGDDAYFKRGTNSDFDYSPITPSLSYSNVQGSYFWAGEDHDAISTILNKILNGQE